MPGAAAQINKYRHIEPNVQLYSRKTHGRLQWNLDAACGQSELMFVEDWVIAAGTGQRIQMIKNEKLDL